MITQKNESRYELRMGWALHPAGRDLPGGDTLSQPGWRGANWYTSEVPETVLHTLVRHGVYENPYHGMNLQTIPTEPFQIAWWYRTEFTLHKEDARRTVLLELDGINYSANLWLNGSLLAGREQILGAFRQFQLDITPFLREGANALAVEVFPPQPGDFTIGFVDWNPPAPDGNMGIFRPVRLHYCDGISLHHPFVKTDVDLPHLRTARLTVQAELRNHNGQARQGLLKGRIADRSFEKTIHIGPEERLLVEIPPDECPELRIDTPRIWWPHTLGNPELYDLHLEWWQDGALADQTQIAFGIRHVEDRVDAEGHKGFTINGVPLVITGGGWTDDLLLGDTPESIDAQLRYVRHMHLNSIRLEGIWGKDQTLYDLCDRYGILMMVGWSCHWEHEQYVGKVVDERFGGVHEPEEIALVGQSWEDQLLWLRHHPSIYVWAVASDKVPHPALERRYLQTFETYDPTRPYLCSTGGVGSEQKIIGTEVIVSEVSGSSGIKMLGPYDYTPPVYWYTDSTRGGAFGFNSETGPGAQVPPLSSLRKMLPSAHLWPVDAVWNFHCARNEFDRLDRFLGAMEQRYGQPTCLEDFDRKAQILNYELMRPMFEAFLINQPRATGIIQWMLNAAWPKMYWQLYDSYLMPNGAFYAARKACTPLHLAYHYGNRGIYLLNQHRESVPDLLAVFRVLDQRGEEIYCESIKTESPAHSSVLLSTLHEWDAMPRLYFLDLRLYDGAMQGLDTNLYWLSSQPDELDYTAEVRPWAFYTPSEVYADFRLLHALPPTVVTIETTVCRGQGKTTVDVILQNQEDHLAFGLEFHLLDARTGEVFLPVFWDDNYIALLPGERRTLRAVLDGESHDLVVQGQGWNCPVIPA